MQSVTGDAVGAIDSSKTSADVFTPVEGKVVEVNEALEDAPDRRLDWSNLRAMHHSCHSKRTQVQRQQLYADDRK